MKIQMSLLLVFFAATSTFAKGSFDESTFQKAIEGNDMTAVKQQISKGAGVNLIFKLDDGPTTPLVLAVRNGHHDMTRFLLSKRANPNGAKGGYLPLIEAARRGDAEAMEMLLKKKAKVNLEDADKKTALMIATEYACVKCVRLLLNHKADPNKKDKDGKTAKDFIGEVSAKDELRALL